MNEQLDQKWGLFTIIAAGLGIASIFITGNLAMVAAFLAVMAGFYGLKKQREGFAIYGMFIGAIVLLIINLFNMGILPSGVKQDVDHLVSSVEGSITVFNTMKESGSENREQMLDNIRYTLKEARRVNAERIDKGLPGFANHFQDEFMAGLEALEQGYENDEIGDLLNGGMLLDQWGVWYNQQHEELKRVRNITPSPFQIVTAMLPD